jgi:hypothetical protein
VTEAPSPSPYAPGIISEERAPPRPAGRAVVFLLAMFVVSFVTGTPFWFQWARRATIASAHPLSMVGLVGAAFSASGALMLVWAYLSDRVAFWGSRRNGYLLLAGLTMAITWLALAVLWRHDIAWIVAAVEFGLAASVTRAAVAGGLAEIGQRRAATGRLAAARIGLAYAAPLAAAPLAGVLESLPLPVTAGIATGLSLAVVVLLVTLTDDGSPSPATAATAQVTIPQFLRSRSFWSSAAFLAVAGLAMPREMITWRVPSPYTASTLAPPSFWLVWMEPAATIVAALGYLLLCRWISLRNLLRIGLITDALALIALRQAMTGGAQDALEVIRFMLAVCDGVVLIAIFDLALRAAPRGSEAFGTILLGGVPAVLANVVETFAKIVTLPPGSLAWFAAAAAIAGAFAVSLLPRAIVGTRDGERAPAT